MSYFRSDVRKDPLCGIIREALKSGSMQSKELLSICKDKYGEYLRRFNLQVMVSDNEIRYRIRRLIKDGLIRRDHGVYSITEIGRKSDQDQI